MNSLSRPSRDDVARGRRDGSGFGGKILCFQSFVAAIGRQVAEAWRYARTRNGAVRRSRKPAGAGHESVQAARRNTKALRPVLDEKEQEGGRSKEKVVGSKCGGQFLVTPYPPALFSLLLVSVLFCGARSARVFFVAKANVVTDAGEAGVVAARGDSRKRIPH